MKKSSILTIAVFSLALCGVTHAQTIDYGMTGAAVNSPVGVNLVGGGFNLLGVTPSSGFNPTNASLANILNAANMLSVSNAFTTIGAGDAGQFYVPGLSTFWSNGSTIANGSQLYILASTSATFDLSAPWALITGSDASWFSPNPTDPFGQSLIELSLAGNQIISSSGVGQAFFGSSAPGSQTANNGNFNLVPAQNLYVGSNSSGVTTNFTSGTNAYANTYVGYDPGADSNTLNVLNTNTVLTNSGELSVGYGGSNNTLTVANGGTVAATNIVLGSQAGSSGTLNIGRFGTNDAAGTIIIPTIAFGDGTGALNFNQSNSTTISAAISGNGAVKQLGAGTTTLSASNTYTGDTTISAGTLRLSSENAVGGSRIIQTTQASLVEFLGGGRMTNAMTVFQYSFANSFEAAGQVSLADAASSIAVASGATLTGSGSFVGSGGLTKNGAGTLSLTAGNSFSGPLNVQAGTLALAATGSSAAGSVTSLGVTNGATLLVSQSHQVNNNAAVTLSGGTITRGSGVSEVFGNLNLTQASFLDFGSGTAGNFSFGTYTPSSLLTINNFVPGNTLVFGSDLRSSINSTNLFQFSGGFTSAWNGSNSTFTITAIPEPSTYLAALGLLALMLWPLRRRLHAKVS